MSWGQGSQDAGVAALIVARRGRVRAGSARAARAPRLQRLDLDVRAAQGFADRLGVLLRLLVDDDLFDDPRLLVDDQLFVSLPDLDERLLEGLRLVAVEGVVGVEAFDVDRRTSPAAVPSAS